MTETEEDYDTDEESDEEGEAGVESGEEVGGGLLAEPVVSADEVISELEGMLEVRLRLLLTLDLLYILGNDST